METNNPENNCIITSCNPLHGILYYERLNIDCSLPDFRQYKWITDKKKATLLNKDEAISILNGIGNSLPGFVIMNVYNIKLKKVEYTCKDDKKIKVVPPGYRK